MNAKPKLTFAGQEVGEGMEMGTPQWVTKRGWPIWFVAVDLLSADEARIAISHHVFGGNEFDPAPNGWLAYEED